MYLESYFFIYFFLIRIKHSWSPAKAFGNHSNTINSSSHHLKKLSREQKAVIHCNGLQKTRSSCGCSLQKVWQDCWLLSLHWRWMLQGISFLMKHLQSLHPFLFSLSLHLPTQMATFPLGRCLAGLCLWATLLITWLHLLTLLVSHTFGKYKLGECLVPAFQIINYCFVVLWFSQLCSARFRCR